MRIESIDELADVLGRSALTSMEVETSEWSLVIERPRGPASVQVGVQATPPGSDPASIEAPVLEYEADIVQAAMVGVFHEPAEPVTTGQSVRAGDLLGTIDALTIKNDVRTPIDGEVMAVRVEDGQPVEYGQALFALKRSGGER